MPDYYHQHITDKSWLVLQGLGKECSFILIGGWAVYLYTHREHWKDDLMILVRNRSNIPELGLNEHQYARIKTLLPPAL